MFYPSTDAAGNWSSVARCVSSKTCSVVILLYRRVRPCFLYPTAAGILEELVEVVPIFALQIFEKPGDALLGGWSTMPNLSTGLPRSS
jgi:hypothetical protein